VPANNKPMALTPELVARVERTERDTSPEPGLTRLNDEDYDGIAEGLLRQYSPTTFWLFAYGSLIWKPDFTSLEHRRGIAYGWHRSFCLELKSWRGTPEVPGLMLALDRGGRCQGVAYRLASDAVEANLLGLMRREMRLIPHAFPPRWITVKTEAGPLRALTFAMDRTSPRYLGGLAPEAVAEVLATAAGPWGSMAEYLRNTVVHLQERGVHDRRLWRLQELVAERIEAEPRGRDG